MSLSGVAVSLNLSRPSMPIRYPSRRRRRHDHACGGGVELQGNGGGFLLSFRRRNSLLDVLRTTRDDPNGNV
jgi:hypothetical protein